METQTCFPRLAEALLLPCGGGLFWKLLQRWGLRKVLQRCEVGLLQGWRAQEAAAFSEHAGDAVLLLWHLSWMCP